MCWGSPAARRSNRRSANARTGDSSSTPRTDDEPARHGEVVGLGQGRAAVTAEQEPPAANRRSRTRLVVQGVLSLVLVVAIFYYLLTKIDLAQVWAAITAMTWTELAILGLLAIWNLCLRAGVDGGAPGPGVLGGHGDDPGDHGGGQHCGRLGHHHGPPEPQA